VLGVFTWFFSEHRSSLIGANVGGDVQNGRWCITRSVMSTQRTAHGVWAATVAAASIVEKWLAQFQERSLGIFVIKGEGCDCGGDCLE
jgi:hypothetical protein